MRRARRRRVGAVGRAGLALLGAAVVLAALASAADAKPAPVKVGGVEVSAPRDGRVSLLVPVTYPTEASGRRMAVTVALVRRGGETVRSWTLRPRANSGPPRSPDRRRSFTFVHRIDLGRALSSRLGPSLRIQVRASGAIDVNGDGKPEIASADEFRKPLFAASAGKGLCSSTPQLHPKPGRTIAVRLPVCSTRVAWDIARAPEHGSARIQGGSLIYKASRRFRGTESVLLRTKRPHLALAARYNPVMTSVVLKVGTAQDAVVRALGDSVTAGFGYYSNGTLMPLRRLLDCKPPATNYNDACSSNSLVVSNEAKKVEYAPDYGLANNVSWAAQWSNAHGVSNYENVAVSGSEPSDWAPGGQFYATTKRIESEDPDHILMTVGANPLLSDMLFGAENMGCAIESDITGGYRECIEKAFAEIHLRENLEKLYRELDAKTSATIYLMQYHLAIPSTALLYSSTQIAEMGKLMNAEIAAAAAAVDPKRLRVVAPPHFNVGIDISPVYPSKFSCSRLGYKVDGPSVQIDATQDELLVDHPFSFCEGPEEGPPWVISGDTGIHPSAAGYAQMASRVPPPS